MLNYSMHQHQLNCDICWQVSAVDQMKQSAQRLYFITCKTTLEDQSGRNGSGTYMV